MYAVEIRLPLRKQLKKLKKKNLVRFEATINKITEISVSNPHHYKNLRHDLKNDKRVRIDKSFILLFSVDEEEKKIYFEWLLHHKKAYRRK